jgi:two-component system cell cycle sensor histidine kinase/response regulator CckA
MGTLNSDSLKDRAEAWLRTKCIHADSAGSIEKIIEKMDLYQAELEVQNEDLVNNQITIMTSQARYKQLYQLSPVPYFTLDKKGTILEGNNASADLLGVSACHLVNKLFSRYILPDYQYVFSHHRQLLLKENSKQSCIIRIFKKNGPISCIRMESVPLVNPETREIEILSCITDISSESKTEFVINHHSSKASSNDLHQAKDQLLLNLIHNINNPLSVISNYIYGCISRLQSGNFQINQMLEVLNKALQQSNRVTDIILRLKNFNYQNTLNFDNICLNHLINEMIPLIDYELSYFLFEFIYHSPYKRIPVCADKIYLQHVIINLIRNAIEAMKDQGTKEPRIKLNLLKTSNKMIEVSVIDNGPGICLEEKFKLLDSNFSTKPYGTGMGLAISKKIIEAHGGELFIENNFTGGACFKFSLPLNAPEAVL